MLEQFLKWPKLVFSAVYEKISAQANKTNTSFKSYLGDDANIDYISNVVYEGIPFFLKFGLKPESFNTKFKKHITAFRDKMYSYDDELNADKVKAKQDQELKDWEKAQQTFNARVETPEDTIEVYDLKDYPNGISPQEVLDKIEAMTSQAEELTTRAKLLKDFQEQQAMLEERVKSLNDPEALANMPTFTSDMSREEVREQFLNMVTEARAKVNAPAKQKTARVKRVKTDSQKAAEEAHNIIMERAQSIPANPEDMSTWTRVSAGMPREEVIAKVLGVSIDEAKKLDKENPEVTSIKKANPASTPKATTKKVAAKTTRKKKVEE